MPTYNKANNKSANSRNTFTAIQFSLPIIAFPKRYSNTNVKIHASTATHSESIKSKIPSFLALEFAGKPSQKWEKLLIIFKLVAILPLTSRSSEDGRALSQIQHTQKGRKETVKTVYTVG